MDRIRRSSQLGASTLVETWNGHNVDVAFHWDQEKSPLILLLGPGELEHGDLIILETVRYPVFVLGKKFDEVKRKWLVAVNEREAPFQFGLAEILKVERKR